MSSSRNSRAGAGSEVSPHTDKLNHVVSLLLIVGLTVALVLLASGAVLAAAGFGGSLPHSTSVTYIPGGIAAFEPGALLELGLLILISTPAVRVVALFVAFLRRREWLFAGVSGIVLLVLASSAYFGLVAG